MKKYKNIFGTICGFVIGTVISALTATYAATSLSSKNVYYDNSKSGGSSSNISGAIDELYATANDQDILKAEIKSEMLDILYPVGSIYITTTDSSIDAVKSRFGGTWERYATDTTLVGYKEGTNTINASGGSKTVALSIANLPSHNHTISHTHGTSAKTITSGFTLTAQSTGSAHTHKAYFEEDAAKGTAKNRVVPNAENGGTLPPGPTTTLSGAHTHSVTGSITIPSLSTNSQSTTTSGSVGSGTSINIQNPYTVVYMYKRTA